MKRAPMKPGQKPMKRTAFKRVAIAGRVDRLTVTLPRRMKSRKVPPNAQEQAWMGFVAGFGCVVCWIQHHVKTPCAVHHIVEGGRRVGHMFTIGLCDPGHHQNSPTPLKISRHPNKKRFEVAYGTEYELHAYLVEQREKTLKVST